MTEGERMAKEAGIELFKSYDKVTGYVSVDLPAIKTEGGRYFEKEELIRFIDFNRKA